MAQLDTRIAMSGQPLDVAGSLGRGFQLRDLAAQSDARQLDAQAKQQAQDAALKKQTTLGSLHQQHTKGGKLDRAGFSQGMADAGYGADMGEYEKRWSDGDIAQAKYLSQNAERIMKTLDYSSKAIGSLLSNPSTTADQVVQTISGLVNAGLMPQDEGAKAVRGIPGDPRALRQYLQQKLVGAQDAKTSLEKNLPNLQAIALGGHTQMVDTNPLTNPGAVGQTLERTATPGEVESARHNRASEGLTARGQNMVDARSREATAATMGKPFEVTGPDGAPMLVQQDKQGNIRPVSGYTPKGGEKPLNDTQSKALLFGTRMQEAEKVLQALEKGGTTTSVPGSRAGGGVGATINFFSPAQQQQLNQAKRDFLNAVLRRESGAVIAETEFDNGDKQYFPQPGDSKDVIAQKSRNRKLATELILREVPEKQRSTSRSGGASGEWGNAADSASGTPSIDALLDKYK